MWVASRDVVTERQSLLWACRHRCRAQDMSVVRCEYRNFPCFVNVASLRVHWFQVVPVKRYVSDLYFAPGCVRLPLLWWVSCLVHSYEYNLMQKFCSIRSGGTTQFWLELHCSLVPASGSSSSATHIHRSILNMQVSISYATGLFQVFVVGLKLQPAVAPHKMTSYKQSSTLSNMP